MKNTTELQKWDQKHEIKPVDIAGSAQDCSNSIAIALELSHFRDKSSVRSMLDMTE